MPLAPQIVLALLTACTWYDCRASHTGCGRVEEHLAWARAILCLAERRAVGCCIGGHAVQPLAASHPAVLLRLGAFQLCTRPTPCGAPYRIEAWLSCPACQRCRMSATQTLACPVALAELQRPHRLVPAWTCYPGQRCGLHGVVPHGRPPGRRLCQPADPGPERQQLHRWAWGRGWCAVLCSTLGRLGC